MRHDPLQSDSPLPTPAAVQPLKPAKAKKAAPLPVPSAMIKTIGKLPQPTLDALNLSRVQLIQAAVNHPAITDWRKLCPLVVPSPFRPSANVVKIDFQPAAPAPIPVAVLAPVAHGGALAWRKYSLLRGKL